MDEVDVLTHRMLEAISAVVRGSEWEPLEGGIITEAVVTMGWVTPQGEYGTSHLRCGSPWGTEGLARDALRRIEEGDEEGGDSE